MAKVVEDLLLGTELLHDHSSEYDSRYVNTSGDIMTGDLEFPVTGFIMTDSDGVRWRVTIETTGELSTAVVLPPTPVTGNPIGLLLTLTYTI